MKRALTIVGLVICVAAIWIVCAGFQISNPGIQPSGAITAAHCAQWVDGRTLQDSGGSCGGPGGSSGAQIVSFCNGTIGNTSGTSYAINPADDGAGTFSVNCSTPNILAIPMPFAATAKNMFVVMRVACQTGVHVILQKNGSNQALEVDLTTGLTGNDTQHSVSFSAGDTWAVTVVPQQNTETCADFRVTFQYV